MNRITIYTYKLNNIESVFDEISGDTWFVTNTDILESLKNSQNRTPDDYYAEKFEQYKYCDISLMMSGDCERVDAWIGSLLILAKKFIENRLNKNIFMICDKRYAGNVYASLPYFFARTVSLEQELGLDKRNITNIVDLDDSSFEIAKETFCSRLFGNAKMKDRLFQELIRFRNINMIGERKIFSVFLCGPSGVGKTESAWILHNILAPGERFIKINLGNYSEQNALSSLIGSPRGYIGSSKGELSDKIESSKSTVILIDEFEKASKEIHNFFLELLSDGAFTDSLGREFDLDKYIVIFTSNLGEDEIPYTISSELWSRFDLKFQMNLLTENEKEAYIGYKTQYYIDKLNRTFNLEIEDAKELRTSDIHISNYDNIRELNKILEMKVSDYIEKLKEEGIIHL